MPPMTEAPVPSGRPKRQLTLLDSISIIVGVVIGAGIYETVPSIAQSVSGPTTFMLVWLVGGLMTLVGALCYAELATAYPEEGGDYIYLTRAFGRRMGFLFSWMMFWVVRPANIGAMALIFAHYAAQFVPSPWTAGGLLPFATAAVLALTAVNVLGVRSGKYTQNALTAVKVAGLAAVCGSGLVLAFLHESPPAAAAPATFKPDLALAMILVLYTYGGWRNICFVAAEVIDPERNLLRSLFWGSVGVTLLYLLTNLAYLLALGFTGMAGTPSIAADVVSPLLGTAGAALVSLLICINCLGNINGMILTNARIYYATGREHAVYGWLGAWDLRLDSPLRALLVQALATIVLLLLVGKDPDAFNRLVIFSSPVHWGFSVLVALSLFILRRRNGDPMQKFRIPWYPWTPLIYCATTLFMLGASIFYAVSNRYTEAYGILAILGLGLVASMYDPAGSADANAENPDRPSV